MIKIHPLFIKAVCFWMALASIQNTPRRYVNCDYKKNYDILQFKHVSTPENYFNGRFSAVLFKIVLKNSSVIEYVCLIDRQYLTAQIHIINKSVQPVLQERFSFSLHQVSSGVLSGILNISPEKIQAVDMDSINAPIHYSFLSGNPPNYRDFFEINPNTGAVKQIKAVDTTVTKKFDIIIKVNINIIFYVKTMFK